MNVRLFPFCDVTFHGKKNKKSNAYNERDQVKVCCNVLTNYYQNRSVVITLPSENPYLSQRIKPRMQ